MKKLNLKQDKFFSFIILLNLISIVLVSFKVIFAEFLILFSFLCLISYSLVKYIK